MQPKILVGIVLIASLLIAGCLGSASTHTEISSMKEHWSLGMGDYYTVSGYVYNSGNADDDDVTVCVKLIDTGSDTIRDSKNVYIGHLAAGKSQNFEVTLDGDMGHSYSARAVVN